MPDAAARFAASPLLPRDEAGPVFAEPWQAQAFALAAAVRGGALHDGVDDSPW